MKAQLATPAAGSPARSPSRVQRQASAGPAPDTPRGLPARAGRSEHAAIHAAAAHGLATPWPALLHPGAIPGMRPSTQVLASRAIAQPKLSIDGPRGAAAATAIAPTGGGSPLPDPTRARMEGLFGLHLDGVRVVESGQPEQLGARAFAIGHEIHAARGEDLAASRNTELLGHELAHVVQQRQGRARPDAAQDHGGALVVDAALEAEADAVGARIGRGEPAGIGGAAAACLAPVAQGYHIELQNWSAPFTDVDQLIAAFNEKGLAPAGGWKATHRALLSQWMREDRTFRSATALKNELENMPAPLPATAPANVGDLVDRYTGVFTICEHANQVRDFARGRQAITQVPQERGDMFDVASALALDDGLCVVVIPTGRADDCDKILDFYRGFPRDRVCLVADDQFDRRKLTDNRRELTDNRFSSVSRSTEYMYQSYKDSKNHRGGTQAFRDTLADTMTGRVDDEHWLADEEKAIFEKDLRRQGFDHETRYALVMYRDSGHRPGEGRAPSHPELDTGSRGFETLIDLVERAGLRPVPMGLVPQDSKAIQPNLIEYWKWPCCNMDSMVRNQRQKENALLRYLGEEYNVVAIGMRSGSMDALAYAGIPIISIDTAAEFMPEDALRHHRIQGHSATSWRRAVKKEAMLADKYHNVYLSELRLDPNIRNLYGYHAQPAVEFTGAFGGEDQRLLGQAIGRHFGPNAAAGSDFDPTSPLSYAGAQELLERGALDDEDARGFILKWAKDEKAMRKLFEDYGYKSSPRPRGSAAATRYR